MNMTYNGRFPSPPEPKSGGKWLAGALVMIPLWSAPVVGTAFLVGSICCFVKYGKMNSERTMHRRFHEFCAIIGRRSQIPVRELAKVAEMSKNEMRQYLQKMIAKGYFGSEAYLDVNRELLILPPVQEGEVEHGGWKDVVSELISALRGTVQPEKKPRPAPEPEPEPKPEPAPQPKPDSKPAQSKGKNYMDELEKTLNELYQLNEQIEDEAVSQRIDRIGALTAGIFRVVIDKPEREQDVRKFMNYYLPTTLKLLKSYEMMEEQSYQGENILTSRKKIEGVLDMLIAAYEKQLDRLFSNEALDIAADVDVLETMMAGDGLSAKATLHL